MQVTAIHQFSFACSAGDGVTNSMFYIRKLLRQLGFQSEIYSETIPDELKREVFGIEALHADAHTILFAHHCLGYDNWRWLLNLGLPKVMVYHNITPVELLPEDGDIRRWAVLGREQLRDWAPHYLGAIGVSELNSAELHSHHYAHVATIPMLVDVERVRAVAADMTGCSGWRDAYNILFVGRISENKKQLELVEMLQHLRHMADQPVRLILAGGTTSGAYQQRILDKIRAYGLDDQVVLTGKVSDAALAGLYRTADAFVCLSGHEGFGMPLIEAMLYDVPVVARSSSNIAQTLGEGGLLLNEDASPYDCAAAVCTLLNEPALRRNLIAGQHRNLQRFSNEAIAQQLAAYLAQLGIQVPHAPRCEVQTPAPASWQIEGPFDSSYSLAIVNRELARALSRRGRDVALRSHEGHGDFPPSEDFLAVNQDCRRLLQRAAGLSQPPQLALRFCYPPHLDDMPASARVVHSYGWEETGFPQEYVDEFNRRLDLVTVLSHTVGKALRDAGLRLPIAVTGAGVDHLQLLNPVALPPHVGVGWRAFRFLHISSCFPRKGVDVLLRAFAAAFNAQDDVTLVIKTFPNPHNNVAFQLQELRERNNDFPHVVLLEDELNQEQLVTLYRSCHAFVAPSRGEGLGLPMAEAMLFGLPVITTAWGGQTEFCDDTTAWCCNFQFVKAETHFGLTHSLWAEPDQAHLCALLKEVKALDENSRLKKIQQARARILRDFTWDKTAQNLELAVQAMQQQTLLRTDPKIGWLSTWNARCGIATYSNFLTAMFPGNRLTILANHIQERMAIDGENVIRCWNASDEETLDYAFDTICELSISTVVIQYNFSFFTLAVLARFIQRLKQAQIAVHVFFHSTADVVLPEQTKSLLTIRDSLALATRIYVHGVDDMNSLKDWKLVENVTYFPHGIAVTLPQGEHAASPLTAKTVIASYGFLLPHKGIPQLIEAFAILAQQDDKLHLLLLNSLYPVSVSKDLELQCRDLIYRLALTGKVTMVTDYLSESDTQKLLSQADLIVFPYQHTQESSSAAVRAGLAVGKPVAVTPLSIFDDVAEAVHQLPGTGAVELANGIAHLLDQPQVLEQKQKQVERWIAERRWPTLSTRLLNLIDGLANPLGNHVRNV